MAMTATLQVVGNPIANQPAVCILTVSNSGGSNVNVTSITPWVTPSVGSPVKLSDVFTAPGSNSAGSGTNAMKVAVPAGGTTIFSWSVVAFSGVYATGLRQQGAQVYQLGADIASDDGTEFSPGAQNFAPAQPQFGQPGGNTPNQTVGSDMQFNVPANSFAVLFL